MATDNYYLDLVEKIILDRVYPSLPTPEGVMPLRAYTGLSEKRLRNVRECCEHVECEAIEGVFIECGVWRGGACMMMAAVNKEMRKVLSVPARKLYVCDSFEGLPRPSLPQDSGLNLFVFSELMVDENTVRENFGRLGLFESGAEIHFREGWFKDTLPKLAEELRASGEHIAILRSDGDMYESTRNVLDNLYPLIAPGGYYIEDDYYNIVQARYAVDEYRGDHGITTPIERIDDSGCYWRIPQ